MSEDNEKQSPKESDTNKYQKYIACSYGFKLVCVVDTFSKPFKKYLDKDAILLIMQLMKVNSALKWWKNILTKNLWWVKRQWSFWEVY